MSYNPEARMGHINPMAVNADMLATPQSNTSDLTTGTSIITSPVFTKAENRAIVNIIFELAYDGNASDGITLRIKDDSGTNLASILIASSVAHGTGDTHKGKVTIMLDRGEYAVHCANEWEDVSGATTTSEDDIYAFGSLTFSPAAHGDGLQFSLESAAMNEASSKMMVAVS